MTASLLQRITAARDYGQLLDLLGEGVAACLQQPAVHSYFVVAHPDDIDVRIAMESADRTMRGGAPFPAPPAEQNLFADVPEARVTLEPLGPWLRRHNLHPARPEPAAYLILPLTEGDAISAIGVFALRRNPGPLSDAQDHCLRELQGAACAALPGCHEFEEFRRQRNSMQEVLEASAMLSGGADPLAIAREAAEILTDRLDFDRAAIFRHEPEEDAFHLLAARGFPTAIPGSRMLLSETGHEPLVRSFREVVPIWESRADSSPFMAENERTGSIHHAVFLPLLVGDGRATGVIYADHLENRAQMAVERFLSLQLFANSVGSRLESAGLLHQVAALADQDGLTGLANRRNFDAAMRRETQRARRSNSPLSVLMIDVNKFKELNDNYGHVVGDEVLIETARLLRACVRETDLVARYGGDEFVILMPETDLTAGLGVRQRILDAVERLAPRLNQDLWKYKLSAGLRSADVPGEDLLDQADKALYQHKMAQVRRSLLQKIVTSEEEELFHWDHYLGKLLRILFEKDPDYLDHARRVMNVSLAICRAMQIDKEYSECVALAAMLHDVGKISIPGSILTRPGPLSEEEKKLVQSHCKIGFDLLREVNYLGEVCEFVKYHHERWDGSAEGPYPAYPTRLSGEKVPLGARILKLADSYDAMVSARPYRKSRTTAGALEEIRTQSGRCFDPQVAKQFLAMMDVQLNASLEAVGFE